ncbi:uncharacterized protein LOC134646603 [Pelmatolapia mariae]|uniref:uncharacterized protein LOC134646603 n=1 Tax=Pelmatolapia mariae TaxID=158779 RepID=UPI002FE5FF0A
MKALLHLQGASSATNTALSTVEDSTIDASSGFTNTQKGIIIDPAVATVSECAFSAEGDLSSVIPPSQTPFIKDPAIFHLFPALHENRKSGVIVHHNDQSSEEPTFVPLQTDVENPQFSTTSSQDQLFATYSLLNSGWSTINPSKTNTADGEKNKSPHSQSDSKIREMEARADKQIDNYNVSAITFFFNSKSLDLSESSAEDSGSGSGLGSSGSNEEINEAAAVKTEFSVFDISTISFKDKSRSPVTKMVTDNDRSVINERDGTKSKNYENEKEAKNEIRENESELNRKEGENIRERGVRNESLRNIEEMLKEKKIVVRVLGTTIYGDSGSGAEDVSGSGEHDGLDLRENLKVLNNSNKGFGTVGDNNAKGLKGNFSKSEKAESVLFEEQGHGDSIDKHNQNKSLTSPFLGVESTFENKEYIKGGTKENKEGIAEDSVQEFSSVDGLLFDGARNPELGPLVPLVRLTDTNKATEEQLEGKYCSI